MTTKEELIHTAFFSLINQALIGNRSIERSHYSEDRKESQRLMLQVATAFAVEGLLDGILSFEDSKQ